MRFFVSILFLTILLSANENSQNIASLEQRLQKMEQQLNSFEKNQKLSIGGRIQLDTVINRPSVNKSGGSNTYDYFLTPNSFNNNAPITKVSSNIRSSRIWFKSRKETEIGQLESFIELDFWGGNGNEVATNSHNLRVRHAYASLNRWTLGQTFSTFMGNSLPDLILVSGDLVFIRQPQLRYTLSGASWSMDFALESPETRLIPLDTNNTTSYNDDPFFDTIVRARYADEKMRFSLATLFRSVALQTNETLQQKFAWGANTTLKYSVTHQDYIHASLAAGKGMGRYLSLGFFPAGEYDPVNEKIDLLFIRSGHLSYTYSINAKLRSTLLFSSVKTDPSDDLKFIQPEQTSVAHLNLRYIPFSQSLITLEYAVGEREGQNFSRQKLHRLMASLSYLF